MAEAAVEVAVLYLRAEVVACRQEVGEAEEASFRRAYHILAEGEAAVKYRSL